MNIFTINIVKVQVWSLVTLYILRGEDIGTNWKIFQELQFN